MVLLTVSSLLVYNPLAADCFEGTNTKLEPAVHDVGKGMSQNNFNSDVNKGTR